MPFWVPRSSCAFLSAAIQPAVALLPVARLLGKRIASNRVPLGSVGGCFE